MIKAVVLFSYDGSAARVMILWSVATLGLHNNVMFIETNIV